MGTKYGSYAYEVRNYAGRFDEKMYDDDDKKLGTHFSKISSNGFLYIEFEYQQLGLPDNDEYIKEMLKSMNFNYAKFRREILLQWSNSISNSPFDPEDLHQLREQMISPMENIDMTLNQYYKFNVYRKLNKRHKYIVSIDPAKGKGNDADSTAIVIIDAKTGKACAVFKSNVIGYQETYRLVYTLITNYIPNSVILVENNIDTIIEYIKNSPLKHLLYYEFPKDKTKEKRKNGILLNPQRNTLQYGINTNSKTRKEYFDLLFDVVHNNPEIVAVKDLVEEIETLESKTPERIEATSGKHDDCIFAYMFALYILEYGTNKVRFGLYFADSVESSSTTNIYKNTDADIFNPIPIKNSQNDIDDKNNYDIYNNPFFTQLFYKPETLEDIDKKLIKAQQRHTYEVEAHDNNNNDNTIYNDSNIFNGQQNEYGMNIADEDAFARLNSVTNKNDEFSENTNVFDTFNNHATEDNFNDDGASWWN